MFSFRSKALTEENSGRYLMGKKQLSVTFLYQSLYFIDEIEDIEQYEFCHLQTTSFKEFEKKNQLPASYL